jgi:hypothetical protein
MRDGADCGFDKGRAKRLLSITSPDGMGIGWESDRAKGCWWSRAELGGGGGGSRTAVKG